jgi:hypothetical protein
MIIIGVLAWFACGCATTLGKWWIFVRKERHRYDDHKMEFLHNRHVNGDMIPENLKVEWRQSLGTFMIEHNPRVSQHKSTIYLWIVYWPWVLLWTAINDPIRKLCRVCYDSMKHTLQAISNRQFAGTEMDLPSDEQVIAYHKRRGPRPPTRFVSVLNSSQPSQ